VTGWELEGATAPSRREFLVVAGSFVAFMWWSLFVIVWVAIAFCPARVAARKGHIFFLYLLFSLVFFPAALIVAYVVPDRTAMMTA